MACKHLSTGKIPCCFASQRIMHPSILEMTVFCKNKFAECPIYKESQELEPKKEMQRSTALAIIENPETRVIAS